MYKRASRLLPHLAKKITCNNATCLPTKSSQCLYKQESKGQQLCRGFFNSAGLSEFKGAGKGDGTDGDAPLQKPPASITPSGLGAPTDPAGSSGAVPGNAEDSSENAFQRFTKYPAQAAIAMMFTCAKCDTRSVRTFSRHSYEKGLVLVRCPGCRSLHLIADHLGWFDDEKSFTIEKYLQETGQKYHRASVDGQGETQVVEINGRVASSSPSTDGDAAQGLPTGKATVRLTAEDLAGWTKVQKLLKELSSPSSQGDHDHNHDHDHGHREHKCQGGGKCGSCPNNCGSTKSGGGGERHASAEVTSGSSQGSDGTSSASDSSSSSASLSNGTAAAAVAALPSDNSLEVSPEDLELWAKVQHKVRDAIAQQPQQP